MDASFWLMANLVTLVILAAGCLWWPRVRYENKNPKLSGEDYWIPFYPHLGPRYSRGPDFLFFLHINDHCTRRRIAEALRRFEITDVVVRVHSGHVSLYGYVDKSEDKLRAAQITSTLSGVSSVRNEIAVQPRPDWLSR